MSEKKNRRVMTEELSTDRELIKKLEKLRLRLNNSGTQRTAGLLDSMGDDCTYYKKSMNIFLKRDYDEVRDLIKEARELFNKIGI